jgi:mRNA interferase HigB
MRVISKKRLREFWQVHKAAEGPLKAWHQVVTDADWENPSDVKAIYNTVDQVGKKLVFNLGGNKFRLIAVIDYERHRVFVRAVLLHKDYDKGKWKEDPFGENWGTSPGSSRGQRREGRQNRPRRK